MSTNDKNPPTPEESASDASPSDDQPVEKYVEVTPGEPVTFEVPANTNLVINVVHERREGFLSSLLSGCSCLIVGFIVLALVLAAIGSLVP